MYNAHQAYANAAKTTESPRGREGQLLIKAANKLSNIRDNFDKLSREEMNEALTYNRKLWTIFSTSVSSAENPLPLPIKNNIASLAVFIFKHQLSFMAKPEPTKLESLININRDIASGLFANPNAPQS
ncbi:MAG: flagellar biosynthesis regulator FlaF [Rhizobiales bacterium]|nr:flagellar biosynthesis regulator FlaF [Hyphomicrobiales bacterium]NRB13840.1 flagellar biosynthesis regulator FlaF [Hyphomicrobiales bacterium]